MLVQPQDGKTGELLEKVRGVLAKYRGIPFHALLAKLNAVIRGWADILTVRRSSQLLRTSEINDDET